MSDPLGDMTDRLIDAIVAHADRAVLHQALSDWLAELISRCAAQSAGAFAVAYNELNGRIEALEHYNDASGRYSHDRTAATARTGAAGGAERAED